MMTSLSAQAIAPRHLLRVLVSQPAFLRRLTSFVRSAVPAQEVSDVTQSVLCEALASEMIPPTPAEMKRWVHGIARHKVADYHRRAYRQPSVEAAEPWVPPAPLEARSALQWAARQVQGSRRDEETLDWLVREGTGESFDQLAQSARQPAANVRQRACRLRTLLRKRWLAELAIAATFAVCLAIVWRPWHGALEGIGPEAGVSGEASSAALATLQGEWRVVALEVDPTMDAARRSLASVAPQAIAIRVDGNLLTLASPVAGATRTVIASGEVDSLELTFVDAGGGVQHARATLDGAGRLTLESRDGLWRGKAVLAR